MAQLTNQQALDGNVVTRRANTSGFFKLVHGVARLGCLGVWVSVKLGIFPPFRGAAGRLQPGLRAQNGCGACAAADHAEASNARGSPRVPTPEAIRPHCSPFGARAFLWRF